MTTDSAFIDLSSPKVADSAIVDIVDEDSEIVSIGVVTKEPPSTNHTTESTSSSINSFTKLTARNLIVRKTVTQAKQQRAVNFALGKVRDTAFILGSILYDRFQKDSLHLKHLQRADDIAASVNTLLKTEVISGRQIKDAVKNGRVGKGVQKVGRNPKVTEEDAKDLASLVLSSSTIDQANCSTRRLQRTEYISIVGEIVNGKRINDGNDEIDDVTFYKRIEKINAMQCEPSTTDKRELLCLMWLSYNKQKRHYMNWEKNLVDLGFARWPVDENERAELGYVVFKPGATSRILHIDEMGFSLDGSKNGVGGRPGTVLTNQKLPDGGEAVEKSSAKVSILFAANYDMQPLPLLIIFPSKAKEPGYKMEMICTLHQIKGKLVGLLKDILIILLVSTLSFILIK